MKHALFSSPRRNSAKTSSETNFQASEKLASSLLSQTSESRQRPPVGNSTRQVSLFRIEALRTEAESAERRLRQQLLEQEDSARLEVQHLR